MPLYTFRNIETGEEFEENLRMAELDDYIKDNPHLKHIMGCPGIVDPFRIGVSKTPDSFKDVMRDIKKRNPLGNIDV